MNCEWRVMASLSKQVHCRTGCQNFVLDASWWQLRCEEIKSLFDDTWCTGKEFFMAWNKLLITWASSLEYAGFYPSTSTFFPLPPSPTFSFHSFQSNPSLLSHPFLVLNLNPAMDLRSAIISPSPATKQMLVHFEFKKTQAHFTM